MNFRVLEKSWKFVSQKGDKPCFWLTLSKTNCGLLATHELKIVLDICQILLNCLEMRHCWHTKSETNIRSSWPNKVGQSRIHLYMALRIPYTFFHGKHQIMTTKQNNVIVKEIYDNQHREFPLWGSIWSFLQQLLMWWLCMSSMSHLSCRHSKTMVWLRLCWRPWLSKRSVHTRWTFLKLIHLKSIWCVLNWKANYKIS